MRKLKFLPMLLLVCITMLTVTTVAFSQINGGLTKEEADLSDAATNPTIKIGANLGLSGVIGRFGNQALNGAQLAVKEVNNTGGVLGRKIELIAADNTSGPSGAANVMTSLILQDKVVAVIGAVASSNTIAAAPVAERYQIPIISPTATNPRVTVESGQVKKYVFRSAFIDPYQGKIMGQFATGTLGAKTAAVMIDNNSDYSKNIVQVFKSTFAANGGRIVAQEVYLQKDQDFRGQLARIQNANPDVIFIPGYYNEVGQIIQQARGMGITVALLGGDGWDSPKLVEYANIDALNNTYFSNHYSAQDKSAVNQRFIAAFKKEYHMEPDVFSALGYDTAMILIAAIKKANSTEPEKIRDALETIKIEGVTGNISFDAYHDPIKPGIVIRMINGKQTFFQRVNF